MATAYCMKCKCTREAKNPRYETAKNGIEFLRGVCAICNTQMSRIMGKGKTQ